MEVGKGEFRGSERDEILGVHNAEEWRSREAYIRKEEEGNDSNEENVEHRRKNIQRRLCAENEDVRGISGKCRFVRSRNMEMKKGGKTG